MSAAIETAECFPRALWLGDFLLSAAGKPEHDRCPGGQHTPGVLGGWHCPCPCHQRKAQLLSPRGGTDGE